MRLCYFENSTDDEGFIGGILPQFENMGLAATLDGEYEDATAPAPPQIELNSITVTVTGVYFLVVVQDTETEISSLNATLTGDYFLINVTDTEAETMPMNATMTGVYFLAIVSSPDQTETTSLNATITGSYV